MIVDGDGCIIARLVIIDVQLAVVGLVLAIDMSAFGQHIFQVAHVMMVVRSGVAVTVLLRIVFHSIVVILCFIMRNYRLESGLLVNDGFFMMNNWFFVVNNWLLMVHDWLLFMVNNWFFMMVNDWVFYNIIVGGHSCNDWLVANSVILRLLISSGVVSTVVVSVVSMGWLLIVDRGLLYYLSNMMCSRGNYMAGVVGLGTVMSMHCMPLLTLWLNLGMS